MMCDCHSRNQQKSEHEVMSREVQKLEEMIVGDAE